MRLAIASGKGGTGKTTVAVNLAACIPEPVMLLDCDVEEPNCHVFLSPEIDRTERCTLPYPVVDDSRCTRCGACSALCQYNAIVSLKTRTMVFPELCHGCGGCAEICPERAITEARREIGTISAGSGRGLSFGQGLLDVGQTMSPPLIRGVQRRAADEGTTILDCPPGTSCPVITAVRGSDYVVLVAESSPFGLNDLKLAVETMRLMGIPCGCVINRANPLERRVADYCRQERIPVLAEIPEDRKAAEAYARGLLLAEALPDFRERFETLYRRILEEISRREAAAGDQPAYGGETA